MSKQTANAWWNEVRRRVFPHHEFIKQTHCAACYRQFNREYMAMWREAKKESSNDEQRNA